MMAAILNSAMLDSATAILDSDILLSSLRFSEKHSPSNLTLTQTNLIWQKLIHSHLTWWWQPSWIWPSWIHAILVFPLKLTHTCQDCFPPFAQKNFLTLPSSPFAQKKFHSFFGSHHLHKENFTHSFWLNLMMADSDILFSSAQIHSKNTLPQLWFWLNLIQSDWNSFILSTWWWQPSCHFSSQMTQIGSHHLHKKNFLTLPFPPFARKKTSLIHSDSTWWWQPSWILPCWIQTLPSWIQTPWYLLSDSLKNTLTPLWLWLKLIQSDSNTFILT